MDNRGQNALEALSKANITANKNYVPNDPRSPMITSGLRFGTPAVTTRGFKENEMKMITTWICDILDDINNQKTIDRIKQEALDLCAKFPVYDSKL